MIVKEASLRSPPLKQVLLKANVERWERSSPIGEVGIASPTFARMALARLSLDLRQILEVATEIHLSIAFNLGQTTVRRIQSCLVSDWVLCLHSLQTPAILFHNGTRHSALLPSTCCRLLTPFTARQNRGHGHAHCSYDSLRLLYRLDPINGMNSSSPSVP